MNHSSRPPVAPMVLVEIGRVAQALSVTTRTLRHYQDQGLIRSHRLARNIRGYDLETIDLLKAIVALRSAGLTIAAIRTILTLRDEPRAQHRALRDALAQALSEQQAQIDRLATLSRLVADDGATLPPMIAGLRASRLEPVS